MKKRSFYSVKGFVLNDVPNSPYKNVIHKRRKMVMIGNNLSFVDAKKLRGENSTYRAGIFPAVKQEEPKIITLNTLE